MDGLTAGARLGPYEVLSAIGAGGIGQVYRARDTRLDRDVAIKVLPPRLAADPASRERLEREAKSISALNHPNVCTLYDVGREDGRDFLVMELVPGETLADRIRRGPLTIADAIAASRQIVDALDAAHERGLVHRDLKPANIKLTADGVIKVLDFGLAKAVAAGPGSLDAANSPTVTGFAPTEAGVILGTAAYMSPEQARGRVVDKRADIWAFGCVLFEMLSGRPVFGGDTVTDTLAAIITKTPDWALLPAATPNPLARLARRCLEVDPRRRMRDIADARLDLEDAVTPTAAVAGAPAVVHRSRASRALGLVASIALLAGAFAAGTRWSNVVPRELRGERLGGSPIALIPKLSPDGQKVAFLAMDHGVTQVAVLTGGSWKTLTDDRTQGSVYDLAWSRDSTRVYFDRVFGIPQGVFSVAFPSGETRSVFPDACSPRVLSDNSLLVVVKENQQWRLFRFWPDTGARTPLNAVISEALLSPSIAPFPGEDAHEVAFFGHPFDEPAARDHLYTLDLATNRVTRLAPSITIDRAWAFPLGTTPDRVLFNLPANDLHRIVAVPRDGTDGMETLLSVPEFPQSLDVGTDGSLYMDLLTSPPGVIWYSTAGGTVERAWSSMGNTGIMYWAPLPNGRIVSQLQGSGNRLMVHTPGSNTAPAPFIDTKEETSGPVAAFGDRVAFVSGRSPDRRVSIASTDGRFVRAFTKDEIDGENVVTMAGKPDGTTLYFSMGGAIWVIPTAGGRARRVLDGTAVGVDPSGRYLVIEQPTATDTRLVRMPVDGGPDSAVALHVPGDVRLGPQSFGFGGNPVAPDGRLVVRVIKKDSWHWPMAVFDPDRQRLDIVSAGEPLDMFYGAWWPDGRAFSIVNSTISSLWRFQFERASK